MIFDNFKLMSVDYDVNPAYFGGQEGEEWDGTVVGKLRPNDPEDKEYVLYCDGDLIIAELRG